MSPVRKSAVVYLLTLAAFVLTTAPCLAAGFEDVTESVGLKELTGHKAAWGDYNNDGKPDLCLGDKLWRNTGGKFTLVEGAGLVGEGIWGDYDRDGFIDFFSYSTRRMFHNEAGERFVESTDVLPELPMQNTRGAVWGDFNGDRRLDLYIGGYEVPTYSPDVIATNNRDGTFSVTWTQGIDTIVTAGHPRPARGVTAGDFDEDGDLDVLVSNYRLEPNGLWVNDGSGNIVDQGAARGVAGDPGASYPFGHTIGSAFGDFDNDGHFDIFIGNFRHAWDDGSQDHAGFYRNTGPAGGYTFELKKELDGDDFQESYASPTFGDIDNDGDLDLLFTTVYGGDHPRLYRNDGNFQFTNVTAEWGLAEWEGSYQAAFADYNDDGHLDLVTGKKLLKNAGGTNHYLKVRLVGNGVFDATVIGAVVRIKRDGQTLVRQVESAVGEGNQNDAVLHFGLGTHTGPVELHIQWPGGLLQRIPAKQVDRTVTVEF